MSVADQALAAEMGITSDMLAQPDAGAMSVWPDHVAAVRLFQAMRTQWRTGPAGAVGLDYDVLERVAGWLGLPAVDADLFADLQVMEAEVLDAWDKK